MILEELTDTYKREVSNKPFNSFVFYTVLLMLIGGLTIFAGIIPLYRAYSHNKAYYKELNVIREKMVTKLRDIDEEQSLIDSAQNELESLNTALPESLKLEDFLREFVLMAGGNGYEVASMKHGYGYYELPEDRIESINTELVRIELFGKLDNLVSLLEGMENLERLNSTTSIDYQSDDRNEAIYMITRIYSLAKEEKQ